jgi:hypothetical protein
MTIREVYDFPDDDGETLERVLDDLSPITRSDMVGTFADHTVLLLSKADAALVFLMMSEKALELLEEGALYVPDEAQRDCLSAIADGSIGARKWWRPLIVEFGSAVSRAAFDALSSTHGFSRQI